MGEDYLVDWSNAQDFSSASHMDFDFLASFKTCTEISREPRWSPSNLLQLCWNEAGAVWDQFKSNYGSKWSDKYLGVIWMSMVFFQNAFFTQPLTSIHLGDPTLNPIQTWTEIKYLLYFLVFVAILLLAIGIINYVNLATAEHTERNKEVGYALKVDGSSRMQLFGQVSYPNHVTFFLARFYLSILLLLPDRHSIREFWWEYLWILKLFIFPQREWLGCWD